MLLVCNERVYSAVRRLALQSASCETDKSEVCVWDLIHADLYSTVLRVYCSIVVLPKYSTGSSWYW